jgi:tetratricopeptide (TPR) repeat protein
MRSALIVALLLHSLAWAAPVRAQASGQVQDPHYGEVLFQFYKGDYFTAIVHLMAAQQLRRMPHHGLDADLLLGGMDLSYGLHAEAGRIFERVLDENTEAATRNQAWYFLGKIAYQRGYYRSAVERLGHIDMGQVSQTRQAEIRLLLAQALMAQARYAKAAQTLDGVQ